MTQSFSRKILRRGTIGTQKPVQQDTTQRNTKKTLRRGTTGTQNPAQQDTTQRNTKKTLRRGTKSRKTTTRTNSGINLKHMKRILTILAASLVATVCMSAQETKTYRDHVPHLHFTTEINMSGYDYHKLKPDSGIFGFTVNPGYRFNANWAVYVPVSEDIVLMNKTTTRNYVEQTTVGLGATYQLNMKDHMALGFSLTGASTCTKSDLNYFKAKAAVNFGIHGIGCAPYVSIGCTYMKPYQSAMKDKFMFECSIGFAIF